MKIFSSSTAFSLLELIVVLVILGIVAAIGIPNINQARESAETEDMRSRAIALQNAKSAFITAVGEEQATTSWNNQTDDMGRYNNLLRPYLPPTYPTATNNNLSPLFPASYEVRLNLLPAVVTLRKEVEVGHFQNISLQKF